MPFSFTHWQFHCVMTMRSFTQTGAIKMFNASASRCRFLVLVLQNNKKCRWSKFWPLLGSLCICRAAAHSEVSKFAEAIADCEDAIRIDPKYSKAYSRLGWVYHAQGHFQEAIEKGFQKGQLQTGWCSVLFAPTTNDWTHCCANTRGTLSTRNCRHQWQFCSPNWGYGQLIVGCSAKSWSKQCHCKGEFDGTTLPLQDHGDMLIQKWCHHAELSVHHNVYWEWWSWFPICSHDCIWACLLNFLCAWMKPRQLSRNLQSSREINHISNRSHSNRVRTHLVRYVD